MSDEIGEDTLDEAADSDTLEQTQADEGAVEKPLILGKYKTEEEKTKGYKELEKKFHAQAAEVAQLRSQAELKDAIIKLADASNNKNVVDDSAERLQTELAGIAEDFRENPEEGVKRMTMLTNSWIADEGAKLKDATSKEISELRAMVATMQESMGNLNPDYVENKALVDELVENGMPKASAIAWAKKNGTSESRILPASMNGTIKRGVEKKNVYLSKEDRAMLKELDGLTDADLDQMEIENQRMRKGVR